MTVNQQQQLWDSVLEKTQKMLLLSQQAEWESLVCTEAQRDSLMKSFFTHALSEQDAEVVAKGIQSILEADKKIVEICRLHKQELNQRLSGMAQGKRAQTAYAQNSG